MPKVLPLLQAAFLHVHLASKPIYSVGASLFLCTRAPLFAGTVAELPSARSLLTLGLVLTRVNPRGDQVRLEVEKETLALRAQKEALEAEVSHQALLLAAAEETVAELRSSATAAAQTSAATLAKAREEVRSALCVHVPTLLYSTCNRTKAYIQRHALQHDTNKQSIIHTVNTVFTMQHSTTSTTKQNTTKHNTCTTQHNTT